ncbi:MAG: AIPR family protein [Synergistaceae bacterium]|nr:AIPR family protein [Synergistaceae bacterium]
MGIYDQIKHDIAQDYYQEKYSNDGQRFVAWYLRNIKGLDIYDAKDCITDGAGDKQIDAVYISEQEETIYILQGKFSQKAKIDAEPLREIHSAWLQVKDLQNLQELSNDKLAGKVSEISSALSNGYDLCFELVTTAELTKDAQQYSSKLRQEFSDSQTLTAALSVIDGKSIVRLLDEALNKGTNIEHIFTIEQGRYMQTEISGHKAVIAVIPLTDCLDIPGIDDGSLFRKNVRHSLGRDVKVNQDIAESIKNNPAEFFLLHNGITAICSSLKIEGDTLHVKGLSVVNGCQSLTTIYGSSEAVRKSGEGYILFRFYEISENDKTEKISTSTNSQNAVKPRDLRSNDKHILILKRAYEHCYPDGVLLTKRGEKSSSSKNPLHVVDLLVLGKMLITWHIQRPMETHAESNIFTDKFGLLFHREYLPENVQALNELFTAISEKWKAKNNNPLNFNDTLFKHKSYGPYWHLFAVSAIICEINKALPDMLPEPEAAMRVINGNNILEAVIKTAGEALDEAFMWSVDEANLNGQVFNPPNWFKSGKSIIAVRSEIRKALKSSKHDEDIAVLKEKLKMSKREFAPRWGSE